MDKLDRIPELLDALATAPSDAEAARRCSVHPATTRNYLIRSRLGDPRLQAIEWRGVIAPFHEHVASAKILAAAALKQTVLNLASNGIEVDGQIEHWRDLPGYEGVYQVSDQGLVRSLDRTVSQLSPWGVIQQRKLAGRILRPGTQSDGHLIVRLGKCGGCHGVHQLVLGAFVGPCPAGMEVRHLDGNEKNNRLSNLKYDTGSKNKLDRKWHKGTKTTKLTPADVLDIKRRLTQRKVASHWRESTESIIQQSAQSSTAKSTRTSCRDLAFY